MRKRLQPTAYTPTHSTTSTSFACPLGRSGGLHMRFRVVSLATCCEAASEIGNATIVVDLQDSLVAIQAAIMTFSLSRSRQTSKARGSFAAPNTSAACLGRQSTQHVRAAGARLGSFRSMTPRKKSQAQSIRALMHARGYPPNTARSLSKELQQPRAPIQGLLDPTRWLASTPISSTIAKLLMNKHRSRRFQRMIRTA